MNSLKQIPLLSLAIGAGAIVLSGCGGGGSSSGSPTPLDPVKSVAQGHADLDSVVRGSAKDNTAALQEAVSKFDEVRQADPGNYEAEAGFAIAQAALAGIQFNTALGASAVKASASGAGAAAAAKASGAQPHANGLSLPTSALAIWSIPAYLSAPAQLPLPAVSDLIPRIPAPANLTAAQQQQIALSNLDTKLAAAETALFGPTTAQSFHFTLADPAQPGNANATVNIGAPELKTLIALMAVARAEANAATAYDDTSGTFNFSAKASSLANFSVGATIAPTVFLPGGTFGTLKADGAARMGNTKSELLKTIANITDAVQSIQARTDPGWLLTPGTAVTNTQLTALQGQAADYQKYLTSTQSVTLATQSHGSYTAQVNLNAWFANPPRDLKTLIPSLKVTASNALGTTLTSQTPPNATFAGLLPTGLPSGAYGGDLSVSNTETAGEAATAVLVF